MVRNGARVAVLGLVLACGAVTSAAGAVLPDGRRYELVSPAAKNGVDVIPQTDKTHVAPDGNAVTFSALGGFSSLQGSSFDFEYLSRRTGQPGTPGWATRGINPLARPTTVDAASANASTYVDGFTSDLSAGIYRAWRPLVDAPNVSEVSNLYRITGLAGGPRTVQLMTDSVNTIPGTWLPFLKRLIVPQFAGASTDLRHVVFESTLNLTADAPPQPSPYCVFFGALCPIALYENVNGVVRLVGRIPNAPDEECDDAAGPACVTAASSQTGLGATAAFLSQLAISADGRRIVFQVPAGDPSGALYLREDGVRTLQIAQNGEFWAASTDGGRVFFVTSDSLTLADTDGSPDLYMYERDAPAGSRLTLISTGSAGIDGYVEMVVGSSPDGHYVYFVCDGQLIAGEAPAPVLGLYVWHDGQLRFIGAFSDLNDAEFNGPRRNWGIAGARMQARIGPDGKHLLFLTSNNAGFVGRGGFAGYDQAGYTEYYLYDAETGTLACASCNPSGRPATTGAFIGIRDNASTSALTSDAAKALSDDGRRVFFNTAEPLVPEDTNGRVDAYEYDAQARAVHLLSSGKSTSPSYVLDSSPNGDDAFIVTRERLLGWDVDGAYDLYDARVGGGFPEPPTPAPGCTGEACLTNATAPPAATAVGSSGYRGAGDASAKLKKHRRCARRSVLRTVRGKRRCVRRRLHRRAKRAVVRNEGGVR